MSESIFIGPSSTSNVVELDIEHLKVSILQKWNNAEIRCEEDSAITLRWDVLAHDWYLECRLIGEYTLATRSNNPTIIADAVMWFYNTSPNKELYLYSANTATHPQRVTDEFSKDSVLDWLRLE